MAIDIAKYAGMDAERAMGLPLERFLIWHASAAARLHQDAEMRKKAMKKRR